MHFFDIFPDTIIKRSRILCQFTEQLDIFYIADKSTDTGKFLHQPFSALIGVLECSAKYFYDQQSSLLNDCHNGREIVSYAFYQLSCSFCNGLHYLLDIWHLLCNILDNIPESRIEFICKRKLHTVNGAVKYGHISLKIVYHSMRHISCRALTFFKSLGIVSEGHTCFFGGVG